MRYLAYLAIINGCREKKIDTCYAFLIQGPFVYYVPECGMVE